MTILPQNYTKLLEKIIKNKINDKFRIKSITSLTTLLKDISKNISTLIKESIVELFETIDEEFRHSSERKRKYYYKNKFKRTITTMFGDITFYRYYYYSKDNSKQFFYIDELFKIVKYDKYDPLIKAWLIEEKSKSTFQKAGDIVSDRIKEMTGAFIDISKQQVYSIFKKFDLNELQEKANELFYNNDELESDILYLMLDEKHVHLQRDKYNNICKDNVMVKHAVLYTNIKKIGKNRNKLVNKHVFSSKDTTINLVETVQTYIDNRFKDKTINNIVISGDGASWIKTFYNDFSVLDCKNKVFILDKFHVNQAVNRMSLLNEVRQSIRKCINCNDKKIFKKLCYELMNAYPNREYDVKYNMEYLLSNWKYIQNQKNIYNHGCSMEGHISHNLAKHFTRDPKAYSYNNIDKHAFLRDLYVNKIDIKDLVLNDLILEQNDFKEIIYGSNKKTNVPILNGQVIGTTVFLKKIVY